MKNLKDFIFSLCAVPSISGFECRSTDRLCELIGDKLEFVNTDGVGNHLFRKTCGKENAKKILIDVHFDEIGLIVTDVLDGGFLRVCSMGGIDPSIMQASDVIIYAEETLRGVVVSVPPHLKSDDELPKIEEMLIDTGLPTDTAKKLIPIGTPVGFAPIFTELLDGHLCGKSFDDKACAACAVWAIASAPESELAADVYLLLSSVEETNRLGGAAAATAALMPDYAMVIDVNLARVPDTKSFETVEMNKGISISVSAATHLELTRLTESLCIEKDIPHSMIAAPQSTGTNATSVNLTACGVPTVDVGLPLASMHTYTEVISERDCESLSELVKQFICSRKISEKMSFSEVSFI